MDYTAEDEVLIEGMFDTLLRSCEKIIKKPEDWNTIKKAFFLAKEAHKGVRRKSGEPYITHPLAVAQIVVDEVGLGVKSVVAALLHDVVEDTDYTVEDIEARFTPKIASMVDGLTKMAGVFNNAPSDEGEGKDFSEQAENFRKVLLTLSDDARVILIKIADRLHNMRTLGSMTVPKQIKITSETIYLFAPLAYRLGLYAIKTELENLCLKYRFPETYEEINRKLQETEATRSEFIEKFISPIRKRLIDSGIDFKIEGRVKSVYSIWSKMQRKQITFEEIYDLFAIRIIFQPSPIIPEKSQCWHIYSLVTDIYRPHPDRIRDWVNNPKANGYEALHATVMSPGGVWVEVQIRSQRMEEVAEMGFAAHWKYKHEGIADEEPDFDKRLKQIRDALNSSTEDAVDFLDNFKMTLYTTEIVVFTPKGESRQLPQGATALDFAYDIHTNVGHQAIGAKINHKIESIFTPISSGDQIEIITSQNSYPKPDWLDHVTTARAKQSIKNFLNKDTHDNIQKGIRIFDDKMKEFGIKPSARVFHKILPAYGCRTKDDFYKRLGAGTINLGGVAKVLRENSASKILKFWTIQSVNPFKKSDRSSNGKKSDEQQEQEAMFSIATCCNPIPGDKIIGYRNPETRKTDVHKSSCDELTRLAAQHGERITSVEWSSQKAMSYLSVIELRGIDRIGILMDVTQLITGELNINIREMHIQSHDGIFEGIISLYVKDIDDINSIIDKVRRVKGIEMVRRGNTSTLNE